MDTETETLRSRVNGSRIRCGMTLWAPHLRIARRRRLLDEVIALAGIAAGAGLHRREIPVRLDERGAGGLHPGIAADLALVVDDLAAAFGDVEDDSDVVRVAVPGAGAGGGAGKGFGPVGGEGGTAR